MWKQAVWSTNKNAIFFLLCVCPLLILSATARSHYLWSKTMSETIKKSSHRRVNAIATSLHCCCVSEDCCNEDHRGREPDNHSPCGCLPPPRLSATNPSLPSPNVRPTADRLQWTLFKSACLEARSHAAACQIFSSCLAGVWVKKLVFRLKFIFCVCVSCVWMS